MTRPPSIPADLWDAIPPTLRPAIVAVVAGLEARVADLEARLNQTSANSSRPSSAERGRVGVPEDGRHGPRDPGVEVSVWAFVSILRVVPTNNAAERALRHAVCWRKTSYGTDSAAGNRFVERVLTVVAPCRKQGRDVLGFLMEAVQAAWAGTTPPSLVPTGARTVTPHCSRPGGPTI
jgi:hypothetical protein